MHTSKRILAGLVGLGVIALVGLAAFILIPVQATPVQTALTDDHEVPEGAGEYAMRLADCAACHTAEDGEAFAGGRPIESPLGTIYSTNITPASESGIGEYSLDQFRAVLYDGMRNDGAHLYPAMPYANYRKLSEEDVRALYDYFMNEVEPVETDHPETDLGFPFNQRWGIRAWKWVGLAEPGFEPRFDDPVLDRGAYLVEGPGHCGACHTPRNLVFAQSGFTSADENFMSGGEIGGWEAPGLRGEDSASHDWTAEEMRLYLASARNAHTSAGGEMALVVEDSLQYMTENDLDAMVAYLRHIVTADTPPAEESTVDTTQTALARLERNETEAILTDASPDMSLGARLYLDNCNACHFADGQGAPEVFPSLVDSSVVTAGSATGLLQVILHGAELPSTELRPYSLRMPGFADRLSDAEVVELTTFLRTAWGNEADAISQDAVAEAREGH